MRKIEKALAVLVVLTAACLPSFAAAQSLSPEDVAAMEARLQLAPEQRSAIDPILREAMSERQAIFVKHGVDLETGKRPGLLGLRRLNSDMKKVNATTRGRLAKILNPTQLTEYDRIVAEQTELVKKQIFR